jgi:hypothetical protein
MRIILKEVSSFFRSAAVAEFIEHSLQGGKVKILEDFEFTPWRKEER